MVTLKVVSYYDTWLKEDKRAVLLEKEGSLYDASGLFAKLEEFEIKSMKDVKVLYEEEIDYTDRSIAEQEEFLREIQRLETMYNIKQFGGIRAKSYWAYVKGISHINALV